MNSLGMAKKLRNVLTISAPTDITNLTIQSVSGQTVVLSGSTGTTDSWAGGVLKITSGDANNVQMVIANNAGSTLTLSTPFDRDITPSAGDSCTLTGGPLDSAAVYSIEQATTRPKVQSGVDYFVHVAIPTYSVRHKGLARHNNAALNQHRAYDFELFVESPLAAGTDPTTAFQYATDIFVLAEQVVSRVHYFRSLPNLAPLEESEIDVQFYIADREGGRKVRLAVVSFSVVSHF